MPSASGVVDLRSDTVTQPTPEMRAAMAAAEVGDDGYGEDPTVNRLQSLAAALLGTEAALFVPSGTMANQLALLVLGRRGTEVLCAARAHVYRHELAAASALGGVQLRGLPDHEGAIDPSDVAAALTGAAGGLTPVSAVAIENTHMAAGGRPLSAAEVAAVVDVAAGAGLGVHCDGARLWNAAVALEVAPSVLVQGCDTVMFCLSKGLAAPVGSLLCGRAALVDDARDERRRLGGRMRQAGVLAAAGIVALETMVDRLADDHRRARTIAERVAHRFPGSVEPSSVRTNVVCAAAAKVPADLLDGLRARGIRAGMLDPRTVRFVTHKDVDDDDVERTCRALDEIAW